MSFHQDGNLLATGDAVIYDDHNYDDDDDDDDGDGDGDGDGDSGGLMRVVVPLMYL